MKRKIPGCAAMVLLFFLAGCAQQRESAIESAIERELQRVVGPAESYDVNIEGLRGNFAERITATGRKVHPRGAPILDRVDVELRDVSYDPAAEQLQRVGSAVATVRVQPGAVAEYLDENRNLQNVSVDFETPDRALIRAQPRIAGLQIPSQAVIEAVGNLVGADVRVNYDITQVRAGGISLPSEAVDLISDEINPIVDLSAMPIALRVAGVHVEGNAAVVRVTGEYPASQGTVNSQQ